MFIRLKWTPIDNEDLDQPVAEWRTCCLNHQLPRCYQDIAPKPLVPLLPLPSQPKHPEADSAISTRRILKSLRNTFGLYQQYYAIHFLDRNPIKKYYTQWLDRPSIHYCQGVSHSHASCQDWFHLKWRHPFAGPRIDIFCLPNNLTLCQSFWLFMPQRLTTVFQLQLLVDLEHIHSSSFMGANHHLSTSITDRPWVHSLLKPVTNKYY